MSLRRFGMLLGLGAASAAAISFAGASGCQSTSETSASSAGGSGQGASTSASMTSANGGGPDTSSTTGSSTGGGGGGQGTCSGDVATIQDITSGKIGPDIHATLKGVVAMSHKFLVSGPGNSGNCLWGVFVSAPGLAETAANTGILALSYGNQATVSGDAGKSFCPLLGKDVIGDKIPDDVKPGDVLDLIGKTDAFQSTCGTPKPTDATIQFSNVCDAQITGTAPVPALHVFTPADMADLAKDSNKAFHNQWGGVKVRLADVTAPSGMTDMYGNLLLDQGNGLMVADKLYYYGYYAKQDICHAGPVFSSTTAWNHIDGFAYLNCNVWVVAPNNKCVDFDPPSDDCMGSTCPGL